MDPDYYPIFRFNRSITRCKVDILYVSYSLDFFRNSFSSSLGLNVQDLRRTIKKPLPILVCLLILQIIMPIIFQQVIASISGRVVSKYIQKEDKSMKTVT